MLDRRALLASTAAVLILPAAAAPPKGHAALNHLFDQFMKENGFLRSCHDQCVYIKHTTDGNIYLLLYVDDMLVACKDKKQIKALKDQLSSRFEMKDLGAARKILGIDIIRDRVHGTLKLSQADYMKKVLRTYNMENAKSVNTPIGSHLKLKAATEEDLKAGDVCDEYVPYCNVVGSLMYGMIGTRPDLAYAVRLVSRFMSNPLKEHWEAVKWILRYIKGITEVCLKFKKGSEFKLYGLCDSDYAGDLDKRRSISSYAFVSSGGAISWKSNLQGVVALSTTEAEFLSMTEAGKEAIWLKGLSKDFCYKQELVELFCDSQSALALTKNNVHHERTKHMAKKLGFLRENVEDGELRVLKVHTSENPADVFTKTLPVGRFKSLLSLLGVSA